MNFKQETKERMPMPDNQVLDNLSFPGTRPKIGDLILIKRPKRFKAKDLLAEKASHAGKY